MSVALVAAGFCNHNPKRLFAGIPGSEQGVET
jgi:hypothetical protein